MDRNAYDDPHFFQNYSQLLRSRQGPQAALEWPELQALLPDFTGKRVLDLGCGFGGLCRYAARRGAARVVGLDLSRRMLQEAAARTSHPHVTYQLGSMTELGFARASFHVVLSTLALHYVRHLRPLFQTIARILVPGGHFVISFEHPLFTANEGQSWYTVDGQRLHWPLDNYHREGPRRTNFLDGDVLKYHHTVSTYVNALLDAGFTINRLVEPAPTEAMLHQHPDWSDEVRRPMFMIISATLAHK